MGSGVLFFSNTGSNSVHDGAQNVRPRKGLLRFARRSGVSAHATAGLERLDIVSVSRAETVGPEPSGARSDGDDVSAWPSPLLVPRNPLGIGILSVCSTKLK